MEALAGAIRRAAGAGRIDEALLVAEVILQCCEEPECCGTDCHDAPMQFRSLWLTLSDTNVPQWLWGSGAATE
jgi:hypothetical protein